MGFTLPGHPSPIHPFCFCWWWLGLKPQPSAGTLRMVSKHTRRDITVTFSSESLRDELIHRTKPTKPLAWLRRSARASLERLITDGIIPGSPTPYQVYRSARALFSVFAVRTKPVGSSVTPLPHTHNTLLGFFPIYILLLPSHLLSPVASLSWVAFWKFPAYRCS